MTVVPFEQPQRRDVVDGWVAQLDQVGQLAGLIAQTEFVPGALRGKPAAVGAAILAGRELGIGPMTSLQHLHVIDGRPSMSAQLMRALVLGAGHTIRVVESSSTRCTITGRRRGEDEWSSVTWTVQEARQAGVEGKSNWKKYPRQMLVARATGELCRNLFADVLGGMAYTVEEAGDIGADGFGPDVAAAPTAAPKRVSRVNAKPPALSDVTVVPVPQNAVEEPELPGDNVRETGDLGTYKDADLQPPPPMTAAQQRHIFALLRDIDPVASEDDGWRHDTARALLNRPRLTTFRDLDAQDASSFIDTLIRVNERDDPLGYLEDLVDQFRPKPITPGQQQVVHEAFHAIGVTDSRGKQAYAEQLLGVDVPNVSDLTAMQATHLIRALAEDQVEATSDEPDPS